MGGAVGSSRSARTPPRPATYLECPEVQGVHSQGEDMAYRMVRASRVRSALSRDLDSEDLQEAPLELEWELEKELEDPEGFRLESVETHPACGSGSDPDPEPIQPSVSPRGRFERLQDDRACAASFSGAPLRSQRCRGACVVKYLLAGAGVFLLGLVVGLYACSPWGQPQKPSTSTDLLERVARGITAEKVRTLLRSARDFNSLADLGEESRVSRIAQYWEELGLKDIQLSSYEVLVSHAGPTPNTIVDMSSKKCYLPNGARCDSRIQSSPAEPFFAAYSAVGTLEAEVVDIQYGSTEDLRRVRTETNVTQKIALLKVGQAPLLYTLHPQLSRLAELGFGASLFYVDPCDVPLDQATEHQAFGVTLNPGGDPSTPDLPSSPGSFREDRHNLTSLLVQPISASLARELLVAPAISRGQPCAALAMPTASGGKRIKLSITSETSYQRVHDVIGYLKGKTEPDRYVLVGGRHGSWYEGALADWRSSAAVVTQIIASVTAQTHAGWQPDRTIVFCSWGGVALGNIGSYEWGEENRVVLASRAVAYVSVRSPVSTRGSETTASPSLFQLASDILKVNTPTLFCLHSALHRHSNRTNTETQRQVRSCTGVGGCPGLNVSSLQSPVAVDFFSSQLSVPVVEFTSSASPSERSRFLSEVFFPFESSLVETLDPAFRLHEAVAKSQTRPGENWDSHSALRRSPRACCTAPEKQREFIVANIKHDEVSWSNFPRRSGVSPGARVDAGLSAALLHHLAGPTAVSPADTDSSGTPSWRRMTAEAILRLSTDPVLPFSPLDIALDVQKKLKDDPLSTRDLISAAASLRERSAMFQSELMRPANDPGERDPAHVRMLNDVLRDLEKSFLVSSPPPGFSRQFDPSHSLSRRGTERPDTGQRDQVSGGEDKDQDDDRHRHGRTDRHRHGRTDRHKHRHRDGRTDRHRDGRTDRHRHGRTDRHRHGRTDRHKHRHRHGRTDRHRHGRTDRHRDGRTDRHRHGHKHRHRHGRTDRHRHGHTDRHKHGHKHRHRHGRTDRHRHGRTDRHRHGCTDRHKHRHRHGRTDRHRHGRTDRHKHRHRHGRTGRHRHGRTDRHKHRHRHGRTDRHRHGHTDRHKHRHRHGRTDRHRHGHTDRHKHRHKHRHTDRHKHRHKHRHGHRDGHIGDKAAGTERDGDGHSDRDGYKTTQRTGEGPEGPAGAPACPPVVGWAGLPPACGESPLADLGGGDFRAPITGVVHVGVVGPSGVHFRVPILIVRLGSVGLRRVRPWTILRAPQNRPVASSPVVGVWSEAGMTEGLAARDVGGRLPPFFPFLFLLPSPGVLRRNILYGMSRQTPGFAVLKAALEDLQPVGANSSVSQVCASIRSAGQLIQSGMKLFENDPETLQ
ncbi:hypothetical protein P4O66_012816 [Electrophorus voltai]|uniref:Peptidase M28 domain-containing protein n=1 Tax=Electrophorus voltai TaxID=2609070 RepID=A0AAD8ZVU9_9TELE|nr:hypothetical protein P4O66_012816 [Electrophorus voltai]